MTTWSSELFIVSNHEPYIHNKAADGSIVLQTPASGLVAALDGELVEIHLHGMRRDFVQNARKAIARAGFGHSKD